MNKYLKFAVGVVAIILIVWGVASLVGSTRATVTFKSGYCPYELVITRTGATGDYRVLKEEISVQRINFSLPHGEYLIEAIYISNPNWQYKTTVDLNEATTIELWEG